MTMPDRQHLENSGELLPERIKRYILSRNISGELKPKERIYEARLASELGTSQSPVREALRDLVALGLVEILPRRGARVRAVDSKELIDVAVFRSEVDALAARLAAHEMTPEDLTELARLRDEMRVQAQDGDIDSYASTNSAFHGAIALASINQPVQRAFAQLEPFGKTYFSVTLPEPDLDVMLAEHDLIVECIAARDPEGAAKAARNHQLHVARLIVEQTLAEDTAKIRATLQKRLGTNISTQSNP